MVAGTQYVATTAGNVSRMTWGTAGSPRVIVMAVDVLEGNPRMMVALPKVAARGLAADAAESGAEAGQQQYEQFCAGCHGTRGEGGGGGPSLTIDSARKRIEAIIAFVKNPNPPMPKLHPSPLDDAEVTAVSEYVQTLQDAPQG